MNSVHFFGYYSVGKEISGNGSDGIEAIVRVRDLLRCRIPHSTRQVSTVDQVNTDISLSETQRITTAFNTTVLAKKIQPVK